MTWAVVLPLIKKFGPYVAVLLLLLGIYMVGRDHGSDRWEGKYDGMVAERDAALSLADHNYQQWIQADEARERMAGAVRQLEQDSVNAEARVTAAHRAELARVEREHARAVAEAQRRADALAERVRELSVAETCHEAMLEIVR